MYFIIIIYTTDTCSDTTHNTHYITLIHILLYTIFACLFNYHVHVMVNLSFINNGETSTSLNEINNNNIYIFFFNTAKAPLCHNRENRRLCSSGTKYY